MNDIRVLITAALKGEKLTTLTNAKNRSDGTCCGAAMKLQLALLKKLMSITSKFNNASLVSRGFFICGNCFDCVIVTLLKWQMCS